MSRNGHSVAVPGVCPIHNIMIQSVEKKMVDEPDVAWEIRIKACLILQFFKEKLPFCANAKCEIEPKAFYTNIVHTSKIQIIIRSRNCTAYALMHLPQIYDPLFDPLIVFIYFATKTFSPP